MLRPKLDLHDIVITIDQLHSRVSERFPNSNLATVCKTTARMAQEAVERADWIRRPLIPLRISVALILVLFMSLAVFSFRGLTMMGTDAPAQELIQGFEALLSSFVFLGVAALFLVTLESRIKRNRAVRALYDLRVLAHIVDMTQLTKDPIDPSVPHSDTQSSPAREMGSYELSRYLDYCSELLALIAKIGAIYVHDFHDQQVLQTADGLQRLIDGLSQKIWHKMAIVHRILAAEGGGG